MIDLCVIDNHGNTPLLEAIKNGHDGVTSLLVKAGALLTVEGAGNCLCMTVVRRDLNFLKRLLANGINPNAKNYDSRTPLHLAASEGLYSMTNLLLEAGASVLAKDRYNLTIDSLFIIRMNIVYWSSRISFPFLHAINVYCRMKRLFRIEYM